jgi:hypothetical protein
MWVNPLGSYALNCNSMRHFALFWTQVLGGRVEYARRPVSFKRTVARIMRFLWARHVPKDLRARCLAAWHKAMALDAMRKDLCGGAAIPEGLALFDRRTNGEAPLTSDANRLVELNSEAIATATRLRDLLVELQGLGIFAAVSKSDA